MYDGAQSIDVAIIDATNNVARVAVDSAATSYITSTIAAQIKFVIASVDIATIRSAGLQFNIALPAILDANSNKLLGFSTTASAVNQLNIANAATGTDPVISAIGGDTNIGITLTPKGTGEVSCTGTIIGKAIGAEGGELKLNNIGDASVGLIVDVSTANNGRVYQNQNNSTLQLGQLAGTGGIVTVHTAAQERMRIDASGNITAGTSTTTINLDVGGKINLPAATTETRSIEIGTGRTGNGNSYIDFTGDATYTDYGLRVIRGDTGANAPSAIQHRGTGAFSITAQEAAAITFSTTAQERMRIDASGNFLLNQFTDTTLYDNTSGAGVCYRAGASFDILSASDNALILNRTGTDGSIAQFRKGGTTVGSISVAASTTAYNTSSDYRLKENVQPMIGALDKIALLNPVTYNWKVDGSYGQGFIAHELQAVVPDCVTGEKDAVDADGKPQHQGVDTSFLVATLVKAVQEQQAIIAALETRIAALEA
jgi:uncharacterized protein YaiE (UPF0345 family)